uniref:Secreted protein n=1 Tax=Meloidogyne hapla TaxID=6305 RepID=A0A1I8AYL6_MELHA
MSINKPFLLINILISLAFLSSVFVQSALDCEKAPDNEMKIVCKNMVDVMTNVSNFI